jgi:hypothetical protein
MSRLIRGVLAAATIAVLLLSGMATPAPAAGPENALRAICEHREGSTWDSTTWKCFPLDHPGMPHSAFTICVTAIGGDAYGVMGITPSGFVHGWGCTPPS